MPRKSQTSPKLQQNLTMVKLKRHTDLMAQDFTKCDAIREHAKSRHDVKIRVDIAVAQNYVLGSLNSPAMYVGSGIPQNISGATTCARYSDVANITHPSSERSEGSQLHGYSFIKMANHTPPPKSGHLQGVYQCYAISVPLSGWLKT